MGADAFFSPNAAQADQDARIPVHQDTSKTVKQPLIKATFYLTPEHEAALEELKLKLRKTTGERTDKSELVRRAIDLLVNQYSS
jgi:hypothetical protein